MKEKVKRNLPNMITLSRIVALILGFAFFINGNIITSICLYIYGAVSDALDGYLARKWNAYTKLGSYLDAISDKIYTLSIIIILIMCGNYSIIIILILELIITIISYLVVKKNGTSHTERVGKFKMTLEFVLLIISLLMIKIKSLCYIYIVLLILTVYFQIQSINAYINQKNKKKQAYKIDYTGKSSKEKIKLLLSEFTHYLIHPVKIIK